MTSIDRQQTADKVRGDPAIFETLVQDHDKSRLLLATLAETLGASAERDSFSPN
jgi:hypothetical protein